MAMGVSCQTSHYTDRITGENRRHHLSRIGSTEEPSKKQEIKAGIFKPASCHKSKTFVCDPSLGDGYDIRTVQELLGHNDVSTTMIYTHVLNRGGEGVRSPADSLGSIIEAQPR